MSVAGLPGPQLPALWNTLEYGLRPASFARRHVRKYGPVFGVKGLAADAVFTAHPEHLRRIFAADSDTFLTFSAVSLREYMGARSVLLTAGETHKRQRKLLSPPLTGARLRELGARMQEIAERNVATLTKGRRFKALSASTDFTLDVIVRTVFGVSELHQEQALRAILRDFVHQMSPLTFFAPSLQRSWFPPWARFLTTRGKLRRFLSDLTRQRRNQQEGSDVLSLLLRARYEDGSAMSEEEICDQLITLLLAGHETTAIAIAVTLDNVLQRPQVLARLQDELRGTRTPEEVQRLPYLSACIDESLRIDPIVTDVARVPRAPFALDDTLTLHPKQLLVVLIQALHFDERLYPEPTAFQPERFLERKFLPHEYAPFGGGVRRCLGAAFSDYETKVYLAALLRSRTLTRQHQGAEPRVRRNLTVGPKHGVPLAVAEVYES